MSSLKSKVKVKIAVAVMTAGLLGVGGATLGGASFTPVAHKPGHPQPPGCEKAKVKYGKKPKKNCPNTPPNAPSNNGNGNSQNAPGHNK